MQDYLFTESGKSKSFSSLGVSQIQHSQYNPRKNRKKESIDKLAERISKNGYEITRSIWVHAVDDHYEVFAGGTRFEASKLADLAEIPVILHEGFTEDEIVKLSEEDNENDEYHTVVNIVDVWMSYKALADAGWIQQRIAKAKGVAQTFVSFRLNLADLPEKVKEYFINKENLNERMAIEFLKLLTVNNLSSWLSRETAMIEIIESVLKNKADKVTAKVFVKEVEKYNSVFKTVQEKVEGLEKKYSQLYLSMLIKEKVRSVSGAETQYSIVLKQKELDIQLEKERLESEHNKNIEEQEKIELAISIQSKKDYIISRVVNADFRVAMEGLIDNSVSLIFTDPPYNEESISLYGELAEIASRKLKVGGSLITYAGHYAVPRICNLMEQHLRYWWIISLVHSGNSARLIGKNVFIGWKPLTWFVKEKRDVENADFIADIFVSEQPDKELHEWQQDTSEAEYYIEHLTQEGNLVVDPFAGSGTTLVSAYKLNRKFWGCEVDNGHCETARGRILDYKICS